MGNCTAGRQTVALAGWLFYGQAVRVCVNVGPAGMDDALNSTKGLDD